MVIVESCLLGVGGAYADAEDWDGVPADNECASSLIRKGKQSEEGHFIMPMEMNSITG